MTPSDRWNRAENADRVRAALEQSAQVKRAFAQESADRIAAAAELLADCFRGGGKALLFGNGGSAADAQHLANELVHRLQRDRAALPALALTANSSDLTAIANDVGFERVFSRLIEAHAAAGDVALAFSTSGDSPNVVAGIGTARERGVRTVAFLGKGGGKLAAVAELAIIVPSDDTARVQEAHLSAGHALCELVEELLFSGSEVP